MRRAQFACSTGQVSVVKELLDLGVESPEWKPLLRPLLLQKLWERRSMLIQDIEPLLARRFFESNELSEWLDYTEVDGMSLCCLKIASHTSDMAFFDSLYSCLCPSTQAASAELWKFVDAESIFARTAAFWIDTRWSPRIFRRLVPSGRTQPSLYLEIGSQFGAGVLRTSLLSIVACHFGAALASRADEGELAAWTQWLGDLVALSPDLHPLDCLQRLHSFMKRRKEISERTPLHWLLLAADEQVYRLKLTSCTRVNHVDEMNRILRVWARTLVACDIALDEYGKVEAEWYSNAEVQVREERWASFEFARYKPPTVGPKLRGIKYGSRPEEWQLEWDMECEEFAGEFWNFTENAMPKEPGAWVDD